MADDQRPTPLDRLMTPVDTVVQQVINHIDLNAILEQIDLNALMERVDLDAIVERSIRNVTMRTLDAVRSEGARLDHWITQIVDHALRRPPGWRPERPTADSPPIVTATERTGHAAPERFGAYAGPATRLVAWLTDLFVSHGLFALLTLIVIVVLDLFTGTTVHVQVPAAAGATGDVVWLFLYYFVSWATVGKTPGMALLGLQVTRRDGSKLRVGKAAIRTVVFPLSFILFGLGFVGVVVGREHRALQDVAADTIVVYD